MVSLELPAPQNPKLYPQADFGMREPAVKTIKLPRSFVDRTSSTVGLFLIHKTEIRMQKEDKLIEIEKLWKSRERSEYFSGTVRWEHIQWEPFALKGEALDDFEFADVPNQLNKVGHFMYIWGEYEETSGWIEWDWTLLRGLYTWYILPEDCEAPLFVNENAGAICIVDVRWAERLAHLFNQPDSTRLGMKELEASVKGGANANI